MLQYFVAELVNRHVSTYIWIAITINSYKKYWRINTKEFSILDIMPSQYGLMNYEHFKFGSFIFKSHLINSEFHRLTKFALWLWRSTFILFWAHLPNPVRYLITSILARVWFSQNTNKVISPTLAKSGCTHMQYHCVMEDEMLRIFLFATLYSSKVFHGITNTSFL